MLPETGSFLHYALKALSRRGAVALALDANFNHHRGWHFRSILHPLHIIFANARVYKLLIDGIQLLLAQNG